MVENRENRFSLANVNAYPTRILVERWIANL